MSEPKKNYRIGGVVFDEIELDASGFEIKPRAEVNESQNGTEKVISVIHQLFARLTPRDQTDQIIISLQIPPEHRPAADCNCREKEELIVQWSRQRAGGLDRLRTLLEHLQAS